MMKKIKLLRKVSQRLAELAASLSSDVDMLEVVVELEHQSIDRLKKNHPNQSRNELIAARKESFARISSPVENAIAQIGGKVIEKAWINNTLHVKLPASGLARISELAEVDALDSPQELHAEY